MLDLETFGLFFFLIRMVKILWTFFQTVFFHFSFLTPALQAACRWQDRYIRGKFPGGSPAVLLSHGSSVLLENKEMKPSLEFSGLPEEAGNIIQWCLLVSSLCCY